ncbi:MAG: hypothetical protein IH853_12850 [Bacteroidetes bacterium]|nr:hypothetical protein [Bacteroidota bacterium]MCH8245384.1 hypothetical protein [Bacteroidota bacterium]
MRLADTPRMMPMTAFNLEIVFGTPTWPRNPSLGGTEDQRVAAQQRNGATSSDQTNV